MIRRLGAFVSVVVSLAMLGLGAWLVFGGGNGSGSGADCDATRPDRLAVEVLATHPHDPDAYTQGLLVDSEGQLWESTGLKGESELRRVDPETGEVIESVALADDYFGEGVTESADGELVQLTWKAGRALRWDRSTLKQLGEFDYEGEGWGISTLDDDYFVMSDGSDELAFRSPRDFKVAGTMQVSRSENRAGSGGGAEGLNELEWDGESLWANRYQTSEILRINLDCGAVDGVVDASTLVERAEDAIADQSLIRNVDTDDVLNGIAWLGTAAPDHYYVTGKRWPLLFEVRFVPA